MKKVSSELVSAPTVIPQDLEYLIIFGEDFPREFNALFADKSKRLFLADALNENYIMRDRNPVPMAQALPSEFREVSLKQALAWYARCNKWSTESSGSVELLCEMAAEQIEDREMFHPAIAAIGKSKFQRAVIAALFKTELAMPENNNLERKARVLRNMLTGEFGALIA